MSFQRTCVQFQHTFRCLTTIHSFSFRMPSSGLLRYCTHVEHTQTSRHIQMLPLWYSPHRVSDASSQLLSMWEMMVALCFGWKWQPQCDGMWVAVPHQPPPNCLNQPPRHCAQKDTFFTQDANGCPFGKAVLSTQLCLPPSAEAQGCAVSGRTVVLHLHRQGTQAPQTLVPRRRHREGATFKTFHREDSTLHSPLACASLVEEESIPPHTNPSAIPVA